MSNSDVLGWADAESDGVAREAESPVRDGRGRSYSIAEWAFAVVICAAAYVLVYCLGPDVNYDQLNYHLSLPNLALNGMFGTDVGVSGVNGYQDPLAYIPVLWLWTHLYFPWSDWSLLTLHLTSVPLLVILARRVLHMKPSPRRFALVSLCLLASVTQVVWLLELGTSFVEILVAPLILFGLLLLSWYREPGSERRRLLLLVGAGAVLGLSAGLRLTFAPYLFAFAAAALVMVASRPMRRTLSGVGAAALGVLVGILPTIPWYWKIYVAFGNPVFPFFNAIFKSPYFAPENWRDTRFEIHTPQAALALLGDSLAPGAWDIASDGAASASMAIFLICFLLTCVVAVVALIRRRPVQRRLDRFCLAVVAFIVVGTVIWTGLFAIMRYAMPVTLMAGVGILAALRLLRAKTWMVAGVLGLAVVLNLSAPRELNHHNQGWRQSSTSSPLAQRYGYELPQRYVEHPYLFVMYGRPLAQLTVMANPSSVFVADDASGLLLEPQREARLREYAKLPHALVFHVVGGVDQVAPEAQRLLSGTGYRLSGTSAETSCFYYVPAKKRGYAGAICAIEPTPGSPGRWPS